MNCGTIISFVLIVGFSVVFAIAYIQMRKEIRRHAMKIRLLESTISKQARVLVDAYMCENKQCEECEIQRLYHTGIGTFNAVCMAKMIGKSKLPCNKSEQTMN